MGALKLKKDGHISKILTWDIRNGYGYEEEKRAVLARYAKLGVCTVAPTVVGKIIKFTCLYVLDFILSAVVAIIGTAVLLPFRFLFYGERIRYEYIQTWHGNLFVPISWMPKEGKRTVGPLATKQAIKFWAGALAGYSLIASLLALAYFVFGLFKFSPDIKMYGEASMIPGTIVMFVVGIALVIFYGQNFLDFLKKESEARKLTSAFVEAKQRRFCPQIEWVD